MMMIIIIIIIVVVVVVVVGGGGGGGGGDGVNNNNFPICFLVCLSTRHHSQIRKEDNGQSIFTRPAHTVDVREEKVPSAPKWERCKLITYTCQPWIEHQYHSPFQPK